MASLHCAAAAASAATFSPQRSSQTAVAGGTDENATECAQMTPQSARSDLSRLSEEWCDKKGKRVFATQKLARYPERLCRAVATSFVESLDTPTVQPIDYRPSSAHTLFPDCLDYAVTKCCDDSWQV